MATCDFYCPKCGNDIEESELRQNDGYCKECNDQAHAEFFAHEFRLKYWNSLTPKQQWAEIMRAA